MQTLVKDISLDELRFLIKSTVKEAIEDIYEDSTALSSVEFIKSIEKSRREYKEGKVSRLEDIDV